jgi:hypothetical protein
MLMPDVESQIQPRPSGLPDSEALNPKWANEDGSLSQVSIYYRSCTSTITDDCRFDAFMLA